MRTVDVEDAMMPVVWSEVVRELVGRYDARRVDRTVVVVGDGDASAAVKLAVIAGAEHAVILAPIGPAERCDLERALALATDVQVGSLILTAAGLALRHLVPLDRADALRAIADAVAALRRDAAIIRQVCRRPRAGPGALLAAFAQLVE